MSLTEFNLIDHFITQRTPIRQDVILGIGDDCALLAVPPGYELAVSMDTLVAGVHFAHDTAAYDVGYKALAVNLSDLAAMGAEPAWVTLAMTLPTINEDWLEGFCAGFFALSKQFNVQVIGGDTTCGPLSITIQIHGLIPAGKAIRRDGAQPGDLIYVTGNLGTAGLALQLGAAAPPEISRYLLRPYPRIKEGLALRDIASSAIDISDGLAADLNHILNRSHVGAKINVEQLPMLNELAVHTSLLHAKQLALSAGDDYELCFTVPPEKITCLQQTLPKNSYHAIGVINQSAILTLQNADGTDFLLTSLGYQHF